MDAVITEIKSKVVPILKAAGIKRSSLFGSYVRGEQRNGSDVDLLVDYPEGLNLFDVAELKYKLEDVLNKKVDLVGLKTIKPRLKQYILSNQIPLL